nr:AraC family transcriptional regulator [Flavobacterium sp. Sd200]
MHHYRHRPEGADQHILIYCTDGKGQVEMNGNTYYIEPGNAIIITQKTAHTYAADANVPWSIFWVHFKGSVALDIAERFKKLHGAKAFIESGNNTTSLFNNMYRQLERGYSIDTLVNVNMCLWHFLSTIIYNSRQEDKIQNSGVAEIAIDFFTRNVHRTITLEEAANEVKLSAAHFSAVFKNKTGFSPIEYFNQLKIQKACQYLHFTNLLIKEIARELGFNDHYYFSRLFTKVMGISPDGYRKRRLEQFHD